MAAFILWLVLLGRRGARRAAGPPVAPDSCARRSTSGAEVGASTGQRGPRAGGVFDADQQSLPTPRRGKFRASGATVFLEGRSARRPDPAFRLTPSSPRGVACLVPRRRVVLARPSAKLMKELTLHPKVSARWVLPEAAPGLLVGQGREPCASAPKS